MIRRALVTILIICLAATMPAVVLASENVDADSTGLFVVSAELDGTTVVSSNIDSEYYLFLPSSADLTNLALSFESNKYDMSSISLWGTKGGTKPTEYTDITAITKMENDGSYELRVVTSEGAQFYFYILKGSIIPTIYLTSGNPEKDRSWVETDKDNKAKGSMIMTEANGSVIYEGELTQIKARGNSTFKFFDKKPYQIKLDEKTDLLKTGDKEKTWVLLANALDATLMHDKLMKDLSKEAGMPYTPSCDWVNLYYDGEYRGVYLLSEKASLGGAGVDITDMEDAYSETNEAYGDDAVTKIGTNKYGQTVQYTENLNELENYTGGYLIELNRDNFDEASGFITSMNKGFNIKSPEYLGKDAATYISEYYQEFEVAVFATDAAFGYTGYNEETGKYFYEYVDFTSLVKAFVLQEFANNPDQYYASTFFYKDADSIMYQGPIWDQDLSFGSGWGAYVEPWWEMDDYVEEAFKEMPLFMNAASDYYSNCIRDELYALIEEGGLIEKYKARLEENAKMNYIIWPYNRHGGSTAEERLWEGKVNYDIAVDDLKWYIKERLLILDERYLPKTVLRSSFVSMIADVVGEDIASVEGQQWYELGMNWAMKNSISDGSNPYDAITREQVATMLYRQDGKPEVFGTLEDFTDGETVSAWAEDAMLWAVQEGIFKGYPSGELKPRSFVTPEETVIVLGRFENRI